MKHFGGHRIKLTSGMGLLLALTLLLTFVLNSASFLLPHPPTAFAANQAQAFCEKATGQKDTDFVKACIIGYNGGYTGHNFQDACGTPADPVDGITYGTGGTGEKGGVCEGGHEAGVAQYKKDHGGNSPTPSQSSLKTLAKQSCDAQFSESDRSTACQHGYIAASASGATTQSVTTVCSKEPDPIAVDDCQQGANLANKDIIEITQGGQATAQQGAARADGQAACQNEKYTGGKLEACVIGYTGGATGALKDKTCKDFSDGRKDACEKGWQLGKTASEGNDNKQLDCDTQFQNPLTWVICPVVDILAGVVDGLDSYATGQLKVDTSKIFCSQGSDCNCTNKNDDKGSTKNVCDAYYEAWSSFRNIALGLIAIAGLIILISQALGMEILDAYTIRKTLPRILIAALGITLSWPLMKFAVQLTNDLGLGVRHLIYAPFSELKTTLDLDFGGSITNFIFGSVITGGAIATGTATAAFTLFGGIGALLGYLGTAALAVFIAVVVLALRQIAIIMLMLLAPIAIVAYVLPNTAKVYKFWWESFSKALLMFPLIAAFIAAGRVFAAISLNNGGALNQAIGFLSYFAPYFLIPLTFRFAGGFLRQIGGFVNDRSKGGFDRLRNFRANRRKAGFERMQAGNMYKGAPPGSRRERLNAGWQALSLSNPDEMGGNPLLWRQRARALRERQNLKLGMKGADEHEAFAPIKGDDDAAHAILMGGGTIEGARDYLRRKTKEDGSQAFTEDEINRKVDHIRLARERMGQPALQQAAILSAVTSSTAYGEKDGGIGQLVADIDRVAGDNDQIRAQLIGQVKSRAQQAGRTDLSAPFSDMYEASKIVRRAKDKGGKTVGEVNRELLRKIVFTEGAGYVLGGKGKAVENFMPILQERIQDAANNADTWNKRLEQFTDPSLTDTQQRTFTMPDGTTKVFTDEEMQQGVAQANRELVQTMAATKALHDVAGQISPEKALMLSDGLFGQKMPGYDGNVLQFMNAHINDPVFNEMRNEFKSVYGRDTAREQAAQLAQQAAQQAISGGPPGGIPPIPGAPGG